MRSTVIFDCEFLTNETAPERFWCGPWDPDPTVVQIGAVRLGLEGDAPFLGEIRLHIRPRDRSGRAVVVDPHFVWLTGITDEVLSREGMPLIDALERFKTFVGASICWSWGKDELNLLAISCFVEGITPPMPVTQFGNAAALLLKAGMERDEVEQLRSHKLTKALGVSHPSQRAHDALGDSRTLAYGLRHLLRSGKLTAADFDQC